MAGVTRYLVERPLEVHSHEAYRAGLVGIARQLDFMVREQTQGHWANGIRTALMLVISKPMGMDALVIFLKGSTLQGLRC